ncbi:MAG: hypothetical protein HYY60_00040 [Parcubacteria group bacterium]|nr:hypothetical protein [Parcubacteria group bacterium]
MIGKRDEPAHEHKKILIISFQETVRVKIFQIRDNIRAYQRAPVFGPAGRGPVCIHHPYMNFMPDIAVTFCRFPIASPCGNKHDEEIRERKFMERSQFCEHAKPRLERTFSNLG